MLDFMPARCNASPPCESRIHWSAESRAACRRRQKGPVLHHAVAIEPDGIAQREQERAERAAQAHTPVPPYSPLEAALLRNGDRQLRRLREPQLSALAFLLSSGSYRLNKNLRAGGRLERVETGPTGDHLGIGYQQELVALADGAFAELGPDAELDDRLQLFRGIGFSHGPDEDFFDPIGIIPHILDGKPWSPTFHDPAYSFACADAQTALSYDGRLDPEGPERRRVLLQMEVSRGICVPRKAIRSPELIRHCFGITWIDPATSQVIIPRNAAWEIAHIDTNSVYGVPLVKMRQL